MSSGADPSDRRPPDIEIGATVRANRLRFDEAPEEGAVRFRERGAARTSSKDDRDNLPDPVEAGVTYRRARICWRAAAWLDEDPPKDR